jgi:hypothetical protein
VRKSRDSGGNVDLNDQPRSGRHVTTVHNVNGQTADELIFIKSKNLSESHSGNAEDWFCPCQWDYCRFAYQKLCAHRVTCQLLPEMMTARMEACQRLLSRYESEGNDFLYSIVTGDGSWMRHYDPELKSQSFEHRPPPPPFSQKENNSRLARPPGNASSQFAGTTEPLFTSSTWPTVRWWTCGL